MRFNILFSRFREGKCTLAELYELQTLLEKEEPKAAVKGQMLRQLNDENIVVAGTFNRQKAFENLKQQITANLQESKIRQFPAYMAWLKVAAVMVLSFVFGGLAVYFQHQSPEVETKTRSYCEIVSPLGSISQVILPDSSVVWLNAGSKLRYSTDFNTDDRKLALEGEGYFQVAKNKKLPFVVDAFGFLVEAVGTEFNVKAYAEEETIETILVEGKVQLAHRTANIADNIYLSPKFKATFYKSSKSAEENGQPRLVISPNNDPVLFTAWRDDRFIFKSVLFKDLMVLLGRKYNFYFEFENDEILNYRFTGTLEDESLQQVMEVIKITSPITYEIKGKKVTINKDLSRAHNFKKHL